MPKSTGLVDKNDKYSHTYTKHYHHYVQA